MKFSEDPSSAAIVIRRFETDSIVINNDRYSTTILVSPTTVDTNWGPANFSELTTSHLQQILALKPEIVLFGSGASLQFLSQEQIYLFSRAGVGVECMDSAAACRTFNLLAHEGRLVIMGLFF